MKRMLVGLLAGGLLLGALAWSAGGRPEFDFRSEKTNPVTAAKLNNADDSFQFAIISDRTGGHRARVFEKAVQQINLLQPEFVVSVGDLIEGYTRDKDRIAAEWKEFQGYVGRLQMPFFYVPGNHDLANPVMADVWKEKFGRSYYEFTYKGVLFVCLSSEDTPGKEAGHISAAQQKWLEGVLAKHKDARWTLVFLHKPMWLLDDEETGWAGVERLLAGRKYSVFAGHVHRYQKFVRQGMNHYMLATTGGVSLMRGVEQGEFDHVVWVTMKGDGPVLANVLLDGVLREDLTPFAASEEGANVYFRRPTVPVEVTVTLDGKPVAGATVVFGGVGIEPRQPRADGLTDANGVTHLSTYAAHDGAPVGPYAVAVTLRRPLFGPDGKPGPNLLPPRYAAFKTSGLTADVIGPGKQKLEIALEGRP